MSQVYLPHQWQDAVAAVAALSRGRGREYRYGDAPPSPQLSFADQLGCGPAGSSSPERASAVADRGALAPHSERKSEMPNFAPAGRWGVCTDRKTVPGLGQFPCGKCAGCRQRKAAEARNLLTSDVLASEMTVFATVSAAPNAFKHGGRRSAERWDSEGSDGSLIPTRSEVERVLAEAMIGGGWSRLLAAYVRDTGSTTAEAGKVLRRSWVVEHGERNTKRWHVHLLVHAFSPAAAGWLTEKRVKTAFGAYRAGAGILSGKRPKDEAAAIARERARQKFDLIRAVAFGKPTEGLAPLLTRKRERSVSSKEVDRFLYGGRVDVSTVHGPRKRLGAKDYKSAVRYAGYLSKYLGKGGSRLRGSVHPGTHHLVAAAQPGGQLWLAAVRHYLGPDARKTFRWDVGGVWLWHGQLRWLLRGTPRREGALTAILRDQRAVTDRLKEDARKEGLDSADSEAWLSARLALWQAERLQQALAGVDPPASGPPMGDTTDGAANRT